MEIKPVTVGNDTYNVAQVDAVSQKNLLSMIGGKIALNSAASPVEINTELLLGALLTEPKFDDIAAIVLRTVHKSGAESPVDVKDFQGQITNYYLLVAEAIKVNLQDFFTYLDNVNAENRAKLQGKKAQ